MLLPDLAQEGDHWRIKKKETKLWLKIVVRKDYPEETFIIGLPSHMKYNTQISWVHSGKEKESYCWWCHIGKDVSITLCSYRQQGLLQILKAYTVYRPEEGYCQAQGPLAALLLIHIPPEVSIKQTSFTSSGIPVPSAPIIALHLSLSLVSLVLWSQFPTIALSPHTSVSLMPTHPFQQAFWCLVQICEHYLPGYYSPKMVRDLKKTLVWEQVGAGSGHWSVWRAVMSWGCFILEAGLSIISCQFFRRNYQIMGGWENRIFGG